MANKAYVSSEELKNFQGNLNQLADTLQNYHDTLIQQIAELGEDWQDSKFEIFVSDFEENKQKILDIKEKIDDWAKVKLQMKIEKAIEMENS